MKESAQIAWVSLSKLDKQFQANLQALGCRDRELADDLARLQPAAEYLICPGEDRVLLGRRPDGAGEIEILPNSVPPSGAKDVVAQIFPAGHYNHALLIAGLDQGWLWDAVQKLPCASPFAPGMRLPIYLLAGQIERLWAVLHYQNWSTWLHDPRIQMLAGPDAVAKLQALLLSNPRLCPPRMAVTVEPNIWPPGQTLDTLTAAVNGAWAARLAEIHARWAAEKSAGLRDGPLRVLGITSRFTTFLQHSMRDWLAAMEKLGHQTQLLIEQADHEILPSIVYAEQCQTFQPDLILIIDHCRGEMNGLPRHVPCVMWIQDRLPNIYRPQAGAMQQSNDYVIGYGRQECTLRFGYPASRFMPSMVGVNEDRFAPRKLSRKELAEYQCDVSFVSHASATPEQIVREEAQRAGTPQAKALLETISRRLAAIYQDGASVTESAPLLSIIESSLADNHLRADLGPLLDMVSQRLNNAFIRHQAIRWVAQTGVDLRLYGRGWEKHPEFARYARGVADNQSQLALIYQASRINLQVTPFGAAHQRLFEGIAAGGFFILRGVTGDLIDLLRRQAWAWLQRAGARDTEQMLRIGGQSRMFQWLAGGLSALLGTNALADPVSFHAGLEEAAMAGFSRGAGTLWPEYDRVCFWSQDQLAERIKHFLANPNQRMEITESMRGQLLKWHTYTAISRRMLSFIAEDSSIQRRPDLGEFRRKEAA